LEHHSKAARFRVESCGFFFAQGNIAPRRHMDDVKIEAANGTFISDSEQAGSIAALS
jgi:hypothetical protein